ncbi:BQ2448_2212 [Microbotryum intermedium]|uniref:D-xylose 1-dehydrogenase (NADP(+), D-xylono-1,5-lactone-forming) n=1 Tax=Microbotryum intermedium TaxID=269621 RepID=A0A238F5J2_9BASI|nr:BQ2448_2212 [Microbotryum intermedium]
MTSEQTSHVYTLRWGILACGWISRMFVTDLLSDPATREVHDVKHSVYAVASRDINKVQPFLDQCWDEAKVEQGKDQVKHYGSYDELCADDNIDCIYIGTPHSHHFQNAYAALGAGKNVLCEKAFTINAAQTQILVDLARSKKLFLMEAVWTRFQPVSLKLQSLISSSVIGLVQTVQAELNANFAPTALKDPGHRLVNPVLGGGALLDLGPYPWTQLALSLLPLGPQPDQLKTPLEMLHVQSNMIKLPSTRVDGTVVAAIQFPIVDEQAQGGQRKVMGVLMTSQVSQTSPSRCNLIQGNKGFIQVNGPAYRPTSLTCSSWSSEQDYGNDPSNPTQTETFEFEPRPGNILGYAWQADEVARCLRDGKLESERMPLRDTVLMMQVFDKIREQGGFRYPAELETTEVRGQ